jgi:hypothetical protein
MSIQLIRELDNSAGTLMSAVGGIMADRSRKMDFNAPFGALAFETDIDSDGLHVPHVVLEGNAGVPTTRYEFTQHALAQLMERLRIDIRTARYILQRSPREATELVNALLAKKGEETMLLRTFDGNGSNPVARSFLSPSYKILDHEDVLETMLPVLAESDGQWESVRAGSSDQRMLFSFKSRTITADASPFEAWRYDSAWSSVDELRSRERLGFLVAASLDTCLPQRHEHEQFDPQDSLGQSTHRLGRFAAHIGHQRQDQIGHPCRAFR